MLFVETLALMLGAAAQSAPAPSPPAPPPIVMVPSSETGGMRIPHLALWEAGDVTCANGQSFPGAAINRPTPTRLASRYPATQPVTFLFTLGSDGTPQDIRQSPATQASARTADIAPAIASSAFTGADVAPEAGARLACEVTFTESVVLPHEASLADLVMLRAHDRRASLPSGVWQHFVPGNCHETPRPRPLTRSYVDYRDLPRPAGTRHWTFLTYDTDADGHATNVTVLDSSKNGALNAEAVRAVGESSFTEGNRTGCVRYFWTGAGVVEAPAGSPMDSYGEEPDACDAEGKWAREARTRYPEIFRRRGVEGWAVLRFDVAPWGEIGNVEVLDAQPAEAFGTSAAAMLRTGSFVEQPSGIKGCITRVAFKLPPREVGTEEEDDS